MSHESRVKPNNGLLAGGVGIVTGGGRGIGRAIAIELASSGASVAVVSRTRKQVMETARHINECGGTALAFEADVTDTNDVRRIAEETQSRLGPITILINNAGVPGPFGPMWHINPELWWAAQTVHVFGSLQLMHAVLPMMVGRRSGTIINVASLAGTRIVRHLSAYSVAKSTLIRLTEHVAAETADYGISTFAIEPGLVITDMAEMTMNSADAQLWAPEFVELLKRRKASDKGDATRSGRLCVTLASGQYDCLSGQFLTVDDDLEHLRRQRSSESSRSHR